MLRINDLHRHNNTLADVLAGSLTRVRESGSYILGNEVETFERRFAQYCGVDHCITVASGTDALELSLRAVGVGPGTKVVTVANAGMYSSIAIVAVGAQPVYVDIDPETLLMCPLSLTSLDFSHVSAIVVTHLYGRLAAMDAILGIARKHGAPVVEDSAQAHGAKLEGRRAGAFGLAGCFSFYPTKNLGALGDGGAIVTDDGDLAKTLRRLRQYGWSEKYVSGLKGGRNSRLDEIQAAVLCAKLPYLDAWNERRRAIATRYGAIIRHPEVRVGRQPDDSSVAHLYVVRSGNRDSLKDHLYQRGVAAEIHYPIPDYRQESLSGEGQANVLPHTERACTEVLTLPCFPEMVEAEIAFVADAVNSWRP
jgi:aminotransferase EvaB